MLIYFEDFVWGIQTNTFTKCKMEENYMDMMNSDFITKTFNHEHILFVVVDIKDVREIAWCMLQNF